MFADSSLKGPVILLVFAENALRKENAYQKKDDRAARSPVSSRGFGISMKSQFYHSFSFLPPPSLILLYICVCICVCMYFFSFVIFFTYPSLSAIFFSRAITRTVRLPQVRGDYLFRYVNVLRVFRSKSHARNRAQQPRNKICNRKRDVSRRA